MPEKAVTARYVCAPKSQAVFALRKCLKKYWKMTEIVQKICREMSERNRERNREYAEDAQKNDRDSSEDVQIHVPPPFSGARDHADVLHERRERR